MNLYESLTKELKTIKKTTDDIIAVGGKECTIPWETFKKLAKNTSFSGGYGGANIVEDLTIWGIGFWLTKADYDGHEYWVVHAMPKIPNCLVEVTTLNIQAYADSTLKEANNVNYSQV